MSKSNEPQTFINPQTGETIVVRPKKKKTWLWVLIAVVIVVAIGAGAGNKKSAPDTGTDQKTNAEQTAEQPDAGTEDRAAANDQAAAPEQTPAEEPEPAEPEPASPDFSDVATEYILTAGYYFAGIDIPAGKFDLIAVSGDSNVSTSNMFTGGVNGMFGGPEADHSLYKESFNGVKLPEGESIQVSGDLTVKITYSRIDSDFTGRTEDTANKITMTAGNYDIGDDVPAGMYTVRVIEGSGNLSCSLYKGGLNELMAAPDNDNPYFTYIPEFKNATFNEGDELNVGNMTVELIPMIPGAAS